MKFYDVVFGAASAVSIYAIADNFRTVEALISGAVIGAYVLWRYRYEH